MKKMKFSPVLGTCQSFFKPLDDLLTGRTFPAYVEGASKGRRLVGRHLNHSADRARCNSSIRQVDLYVERADISIAPIHRRVDRELVGIRLRHGLLLNPGWCHRDGAVYSIDCVEVWNACSAITDVDLAKTGGQLSC